MRVPGLAAQEELDESDSPLDQSPGDQAASAIFAGVVLIQAIEASDRLGSLVMSSASLAAVCMAAASS